MLVQICGKLAVQADPRLFPLFNDAHASIQSLFSKVLQPQGRVRAASGFIAWRMAIGGIS